MAHSQVRPWGFRWPRWRPRWSGWGPARKLRSRISPAAFRRVFLAFLLVLGAQMVVRSLL